MNIFANDKNLESSFGFEQSTLVPDYSHLYKNYCQKTTYSCCPNRLERKAAHSHTEFTMNGTKQSVNHKLVPAVFEPIPFVCSFLAKASKAEQLMNATQESVNHLYF